MVVSIDKATAVKMYDRVQHHWRARLELLREQHAAATGPERDRLQALIAGMEETDMAVVVSQSQNEIERLQKEGVDILPHRQRMVKEDMESKFKDHNDPFRIVFVCAMWMTGFDVPSCATIYLDKPMRNHTLMQTIARANRVFPEKVNGVIVDYVGVFRNLQQALAIYAAPPTGGRAGADLPVERKAAQVEQLRQAVDHAVGFLRVRGVDPDAIIAASGFARIALLDAAVEAVLENDDTKAEYLHLANTAARLYRAILPDEAASEFAPRCTLLAVIANKIQSLVPPADIAEVMTAVEQLLDESVAAESYVIDAGAARNLIDLSAFDFEALRHRFQQGRRRAETERLRGAISARLRRMVLNRSRMDYQERFQRMIDEYNAGASNVDALFNMLIQFAQQLTEEEKRGVAELLSEEELALFDLLTRPDIQLTEDQTRQVKAVARDLLATLKNGKLVLDWRKKQAARAAVRQTIEEILDQLPAIYTKDLYQAKCDETYQHVYDSYFGQGRSIYALAS
jgi:type I restriction enzyme R subunit